MDKIAVVAARECLDRAKEALTTMVVADGFDKLEKAWTDFLTMANRIYTKLEQGSKASGKSRGWYGQKRGERRKDPLLSYIKNARDADEHGLQRITKRRGPGLGITSTTGTLTLDKPMVVSNTTAGSIVSFPDGLPPEELIVKFFPASVRLVEVTNHGDKYQPPGDTDPISVSKKAVTHFEVLIAEADALS